ncbi:MAG: hypothetical protein KJ000_23310 [Pirellulaceae bacterium]|nr:hypothetical protein [Pirellulaceae bacterium]
MPGPGPIGIAQSPNALPEPSGILARAFPLAPGPDGAVRGDWVTAAERAASDAPEGTPETATTDAATRVCSLLEPSTLPTTGLRQ